MPDNIPPPNPFQTTAPNSRWWLDGTHPDIGGVGGIRSVGNPLGSPSLNGLPALMPRGTGGNVNALNQLSVSGLMPTPASSSILPAALPQTTPAPPNTIQYQDNAPNTDPQDFLSGIRGTIGNVLGAGMNVIDAPGHYFARPIAELMTDPIYGATITNSGDDLFTKINLLNEGWHDNQLPGIAKFGIEAALDPTTYLSAGLARGVTGAKYIKPLIESIPGGAKSAEMLVGGLQKYEDVVSSAFSGLGGLIYKPGSGLIPASGLAANYIPLGVAKANAKSVLTKFLPNTLVDGVLRQIPDEYTGVNINGIARLINKQFPTVGLPEVLKVPEIRAIQTQSAANITWDATHNAFLEYGHNLGLGSSPAYIRHTLRDIYTKPQNVLTDNEAVVADVLKNPNPLNRTDLRQLNTKVSGTNTKPTLEQAFTLNQLVSDYRRNPNMAGLPSNTQATEDATIKAIGQLTNVDFRKTPESYTSIQRWLRGRSDESANLIETLSNHPNNVQGVFDQLADTARRRTDRAFTTGIEVQRQQNTMLDQALNRFDNVYTAVWRDGIQKFITRPLSTMYLQFGGYVPQNAIESAARHAIGGAGMVAPIDETSFRIAHGLVENTPRELLAAKGTGGFLAQDVANTRFSHNGPLGILANNAPGNWALNQGNAIELAVRRSFWDKTLSAQLDQVAASKGLGATTSTRDWFAAVAQQDVNNVPELAGLSQGIFNDINSMAIHTVPHGQQSVDALTGWIDAGIFNREKLAASIDDPAFHGLDPSSRQMWINFTKTGEASGDAANKAIQDIIDNEKNLIAVSPMALEQKFKGLADHLANQAASPVYTMADLANGLKQVTAHREQFVGIPEVMRQVEMDKLTRAQLDGTYRQQIHDDIAKQISDSLEVSNAHLNRAYGTLQEQADKFGLSEQASKYIGHIKADNDLLVKTWGADEAFRTEFFKGMSKAERQMPSTWTDYFAQRKAIWDDYLPKHAESNANQAAAELELRQAIVLKTPPTVNAVNTPPTESQLTPLPEIKWKPAHSGNHEAEFNGQTIRIIKENSDYGDSGWWGYMPNGERMDSPARTLKEAKDRMAIQLQSQQPPIPVDPVMDSMSEEIVNGIKDGSDSSVILARVHNKRNDLSGNEGAGQPITPGGIESGNPITGSTTDASLTTGTIGPSATATIPGPNDSLSALYDAADAIRPGLESKIQDVFNNPAMTQDHVDYLKDRIQNMSRVFNSMDQSGQRVLNDTLKEAAARTKQMYEQTFVNYDSQSAFDWLAKQVFPFWTYESRRWPYLARTAIQHPGLAAAYTNYMDKTDQGYIPLGELPVDANPLRGTVLGGINRATGRDYPLKYTEGLQGGLESIEATLGKMGLYLGPQFSIPSQVIRGEGGQTLPPMMSSALNLGRYLGAPGTAGLENVLPDQFRDYYVRQILASQGQEPDKILEKAAATPDGTESQILDQAQKQAGLVSFVLQQTGVLRFRTPQYTQYQNDRSAAIEKFTGIPVSEQQRLQGLGINVQQISSLGPDQRSQLAAIPGTKEFSQVSEPLLNPVAQKMRQSQREFFDTVKQERDALNVEQSADDTRMQSGVISGNEWRIRYKDRNSKISDMVQNLKKSPAYTNVPVTADEQIKARQRFNLPTYVDSPTDILLNEYRSVAPETDAVTGEVNWPKFFDDRDAVLAKYPTPLIAAAKMQIEKNDTPQVQDFRRAMEVLRPYFGIKDEILKQYPQLQDISNQAQALTNANPVQGAMFRENSPELKVMNQLITNYQKAARVQFPQVDAYLTKYFGATPISYELLKKTSTSGPSKPHLSLSR